MLLTATSRRRAKLLGAVIFQELPWLVPLPLKVSQVPQSTHLFSNYILVALTRSFFCMFLYYADVASGCTYPASATPRYCFFLKKKLGDFDILCWWFLCQFWIFPDFILLLCLNEAFTVGGVWIWFKALDTFFFFLHRTFTKVNFSCYWESISWWILVLLIMNLASSCLFLFLFLFLTFCTCVSTLYDPHGRFELCFLAQAASEKYRFFNVGLREIFGRWLRKSRSIIHALTSCIDISL